VVRTSWPRPGDAEAPEKPAADMPIVILDLPIPAGFAVLPDEFDALVAFGRIAGYQITP
jgi:hypothetical protein